VVTLLVVEMARRDDGDGRSGPAPVGADAAMRQAVLYVDRHFREPLTLAEVAAQAHLSPNYCSQRFREVAGTSFQAYLQERRLRFARSLLEATGLAVTEVCHAAGFGDLSHFGRVYRRRYGVPPSARSRGGSAQ
jgi:AraC-like DNA-binding protein